MRFASAFLILLVIVAIGGYFLLGGESQQSLTEVETVEVTPKPPSLGSDLNKSLIARLVSEDADIKKALEGETEEVEGLEGDDRADLYAPKSNEEILFDMMAPWFYMGFRNIINNEAQGRFKNNQTKIKSGWLTIGGTLEGAEIVHLDADKAVVQFADATHEFRYVPEYAEKVDPTVPRTPEQIRAAQRRYAEVYMPTFIKQNREYEKLRGQRTVPDISPRKQKESQLEYLQYAQEFAENSGGRPPSEALIDASELTEEQKKAHQKYKEMYERSPEDILERINSQRRALEEELGAEPGNPAPSEEGAAGQE